MGTHKLLDKISETFLWENISAHIGQTRLLPDMLHNAGYIENKDELMRKADGADILDSEPPEISKVNADNGRFTFSFTMPFILIVKSGKQQLLRITATAAGNCSIPDESAFEWETFDWDNMSRQELLAHKDVVEFSQLCFEDMECDDLTV